MGLKKIKPISNPSRGYYYKHGAESTSVNVWCHVEDRSHDFVNQSDQTSSTTSVKYLRASPPPPPLPSPLLVTTLPLSLHW